MQKLGMKPVPGVSRVTIKKSKNVRLARAELDSSSYQPALQQLIFASASRRAAIELDVANGADLVCHLQARCVQVPCI